MELRNIITFLKIVETGSFTKAANQLGYNQSTVTVQVQQLEQELGVMLFNRMGLAHQSDGEGLRISRLCQ